jgi:hypothetical protein
MQGVGCADDLLYFKRPTTQQMRCPVNAYPASLKGITLWVRIPAVFSRFIDILILYAFTHLGLVQTNRIDLLRS